MVATVPSAITTPNPKLSSRPAPSKAKREPLLPSEADNNAPPIPRRPKSRDVSSRYLSSSSSSSSSSTITMTSTSSSSSFSSTTTTSSSNSMCTPRRRFPSPVVSRTIQATPASTVNNKRAQSAERRRLGEMSARSLSVSFQGESFAVPLSKAVKQTSNGSSNGSRHGTPERRALTPARNLGNSKAVEQQRWPARSRQGSFMTESVDFTNENVKLSGSGTASAVRALQKSMIGERKLKSNKPEILELNRTVDKLVCDSISDAESVSSGSTIRGGTPRAIVVPARFRQETVNRLRRVQTEPVSPPLSKNNKLLLGNRYLRDGPVLSPRGSSTSPIRGAVRPASPSRSAFLSSNSSPSRGIASPTRARIGCSDNLGNTPSILSFGAEARRRKVGENALVDAHVLRLLHNKHLQWRFANARADAAMLVQRAIAQKTLYNAWVTMSKMRQSVVSKQIEIQQLRQNLKLHSLLKTQIPYLNIWDEGERDHSVSLSGAIVSLESSTLRLPLVNGAKVDVQNLKDAISSAVDVMQAMASSICSLLAKVDHVNALASQLASTTTNERSLLDHCKDLLSTLTHMEVQDCSLRTHVLQVQR